MSTQACGVVGPGAGSRGGELGCGDSVGRSVVGVDDGPASGNEYVHAAHDAPVLEPVAIEHDPLFTSKSQHTFSFAHDSVLVASASIASGEKLAVVPSTAWSSHAGRPYEHDAPDGQHPFMHAGVNG